MNTSGIMGVLLGILIILLILYLVGIRVNIG